MTHLATDRESGHFRGSQGCVGQPAWRACDCVGSVIENGDLLLPVCQGERTASVHEDTMSGQKELILATRFKMEDPGYGAKG